MNGSQGKAKPQVGGRTIAALAHVVAEIRGSTGAAPWQPEGVAPALVEALDNRACTGLEILAFAAIRAALDPKNRTPAIIARDGRHWHETATGETSATARTYPKCSRCQHELLPHAGETRETHVCADRIERGAPEVADLKAQLRARLAEQTKAYEQQAAAAAAAVALEVAQR